MSSYERLEERIMEALTPIFDPVIRGGKQLPGSTTMVYFAPEGQAILLELQIKLANRITQAFYASRTSDLISEAELAFIAELGT